MLQQNTGTTSWRNTNSKNYWCYIKKVKAFFLFYKIFIVLRIWEFISYNISYYLSIKAPFMNTDKRTDSVANRLKLEKSANIQKKARRQ